MTAVAERPTAPPPPGHRRSATADGSSSPPATGTPGGNTDVAQLLSVVVLLLVALVPIGRVFDDTLWVRPVAAGVLVAVGLCWGLRQFGAGGLVTMAASVLAWLGFTSAVLAPATARFGVVPTRDTLDVGRVLLTDAAELIRAQSSPVEPEPALLLVAIAGTWVIATAVCDAAFIRRVPLAAVGIALVGFSVPLPLAARTSGLALAVPFLIAAAGVLLAFGSVDLRRWAGPSSPRTRAPGRRGGLVTGAVLTTLAVGAGVLLADALPGFGEPPLYEIRGQGGPPSTDNPMVDLRTRLTASDGGTVLEVTTERPMYLRTAALDTYEDQSWTAESIRGTPVAADGVISPEVEASSTEEVTVGVEVGDLRGELVPVPYPAIAVDGPLAEYFQHDDRNGTVILDGGEQIGEGDAYTVTAAVPDPDAARVGASEGFAPDSHLTSLPDTVPARVEDLARQVTAEADATTPLQQALAIQDELQTWNYSLEPPGGHGPDALDDFLDSRTGYCEQFAATMALMLRTLDIPARVAVGYTPGTLVDPDEGRWQISHDNAHAWVEVLFGESGWLAFEPTPRSDGNVLVPTAANLTPSDTAAGDTAPPDIPDLGGEDALVPDTDGDVPFDGQSLGEETDVTATAAGDDRRTWPWVAAGLGFVVAAWAALTARRSAPETAGAAARVRAARERAERLGQALGVPPRASDTDREFLTRLAQQAPNGAAGDAAHRLAAESARARYFPDVSADAAARAEAATATLVEAMPPSEGAVDRARRAVRVARARMARSPLYTRVRGWWGRRSG